jgi:hypothetical protein
MRWTLDPQSLWTKLDIQARIAIERLRVRQVERGINYLRTAFSPRNTSERVFQHARLFAQSLTIILNGWEWRD